MCSLRHFPFGLSFDFSLDSLISGRKRNFLAGRLLTGQNKWSGVSNKKCWVESTIRSVWSVNRIISKTTSNKSDVRWGEYFGLYIRLLVQHVVLIQSETFLLSQLTIKCGTSNLICVDVVFDICKFEILKKYDDHVFRVLIKKFWF